MESASIPLGGPPDFTSTLNRKSLTHIVPSIRISVSLPNRPTKSRSNCAGIFPKTRGVSLTFCFSSVRQEDDMMPRLGNAHPNWVVEGVVRITAGSNCGRE
ncbi:hypothetical protein CEXT_661661 [Caerostris extrusa]|uniref:Uncharacterized protein n=1 Tax=Caerostris extrusa TaxID=172846 RepID=A0AAV4W9B4_CAEEX|nr:hypothetical protein CEXT_661661 [Caerostris extrusa]